MRVLWQRLYEDLMRAISTGRAYHEFDQMRARRAALAPFVAPAALIEFLREANGALDEKDSIYFDLLREAQASHGSARLATNLLWLGLWPGLSGVYRRCCRFYMGERDELVAAISDHFESLIRDADHDAITKPAATFVKSCERLVKEERFAAWERQAARADDVDVEGLHRDKVPDPRFPMDLPPTPSHVQVEETFYSWVEQILGEDAELVIAHLEGTSHIEIAEQIGATHGAVRKRYERLRKRLVEEIDKKMH